MSDESKCPFSGHKSKSEVTVGGGTPSLHWWPKQLRVDLLNQHSERSNPLGKEFNYRQEFKKLDYYTLKADIKNVLTDSQDWWPADWGNYTGLFIRLAWHAAGTYRMGDGRGGAGRGQQRFAPLNSWPDNASLDKARRLLWPVKQKYGQKISWADLFILAGNIALESSGFRTFGFGAGREDVWEPDNDVNWGDEKEWLAHRNSEALEGSNLAATEMGLIYVNPEGPQASGDPKSAAPFIRATFGNMAMDDEEIVALIAGGHTLGKTHGAASADHVQADPEGASIEQMGFGWSNSFGTGVGKDAITSGLEVIWSQTPTQWSNNYFANLFGFEWELTKSPAGAQQWVAKTTDAIIPDAFDPTKKQLPTMLTTDLSMRFDPAYNLVSQRFMEHPEQFEDAFARAWFKLTHRDMGPRNRYVGKEVPAEVLIWQDPIPANTYTALDASDIAKLKGEITASGLTVSQLVSTAWASASTFRGSDKRGGANGGRVRLAPQKYWKANNPAQLGQVLDVLEKIQTAFNAAQTGGKGISIADTIVLGGCVGVEMAAKNAGHHIEVPFTAGRGDATEKETDVESFSVLEPHADAFRNYNSHHRLGSAEELMIDQAQLLNLTAPEMAVLLGGMRVLNTNFDNSNHGVFTTRPEALTNDFYVNLLDINTTWSAVSDHQDAFVGKHRKTGETVWTGTRVDLIMGSNSELRAIAEVYGYPAAEKKFVNDFVAAWNKVMNLDRFDL